MNFFFEIQLLCSWHVIFFEIQVFFSCGIYDSFFVYLCYVLVYAFC